MNGIAYMSIWTQGRGYGENKGWAPKKAKIKRKNLTMFEAVPHTDILFNYLYYIHQNTQNRNHTKQYK
jgi:hypothetical protein